MPAAGARRRTAPCRPGRPGRPSCRSPPTPTPSPGRSSATAEADPEIVAITAAMPGPTGLLPFEARFPDRFLDVGIAEQHAVTAAAGHGHGRAPPGGGRLLDLLHPRLRPGQPRRRAAPPARGVRPRPGRHHRRRRPQPPRRPRPVAGPVHPGHDGLRPVVGPRGRGHAGRGPDPRRARRSSASRRRRRRGWRAGAVGHRACRPARSAGATARSASWPWARWSTRPRRRPDKLAAEGIDATVWDVAGGLPPDPAMLADAAGHRLVVTVEDGIRQGGAGMFLADAIRGRCPLRPAAPPVRLLGIPRAYIAQGKPDRILAELGLDGPGLARRCAEVAAPAPATRPERRRPVHPATAVPTAAPRPPSTRRLSPRRGRPVLVAARMETCST